jgi:hypothetical protein
MKDSGADPILSWAASSALIQLVLPPPGRRTTFRWYQGPLGYTTQGQGAQSHLMSSQGGWSLVVLNLS